MIYWTWTWKINKPSYWTQTNFRIYWELDLKSTQSALLDLNWFYDILDLDLKNPWINLLNSDSFYYNQAGMLLEKYESLLILSVKQLLIQSSLARSISQGQTMYGVWETKILILFVTKLGVFRNQQELSKSKSNLIPFNR